MEFLLDLFHTALATAKDVLPIAVILFGFQVFVLRRPIANLPRVLLGFVFVLLGLTLFLDGLASALFPLGRLMAEQLTHPDFIGTAGDWRDYGWVYVFAAAIGISAPLAEPALIAVAIKANQVSGGTISVWGLRLAVAFGAAIGITIGTFRLVTGTPLHWYITAGYVIVVIQTLYAPKAIIPLAYDSGGVTTSTVTVPLVAALGLGLATQIPGRSPVLDGFGMIATTVLFPMVTVMGYAQISEWRARRRQKSVE
jgi:hypothetical protein